MKNSNKKTVFIVDDQPVYANVLKGNIENSSTKVFTFSNGEDCLAAMDMNPEVIVLDFELDGGTGKIMNGIAVLKKLKEEYPNTEVVMLSGHEDVKIATTSIKFGAYDYVVKNENALINVKNKLRNIYRKLNILGELKEVNILKQRITAIAILATVFAVVINGFIG